jgi:hypothetical protein
LQQQFEFTIQFTIQILVLLHANWPVSPDSAARGTTMDRQHGSYEQYQNEPKKVYQSGRQVAIRAGDETERSALPGHGPDRRPTGLHHNQDILP